MEGEKRGLAVEDDSAVCEGSTACSSRRGWRYCHCPQAKRPGTVARGKVCSAVLPPADGVSGRRRANTAGARFGLESSDAVILLSDDPSTKALSEGFLAGASFFFCKPIDKTVCSAWRGRCRAQSNTKSADSAA